MRDDLVVAFGICVVLPIAGLLTAYLFRRLSSRERMRAIERGVNIPFDSTSPRQRAARVRRLGIVLVALGVGIALTFTVGYLVERDKGMLIAAAFGFIPALIGVGLLIDYRLLRKESDDEPAGEPKRAALLA
jgi:di/tricarboxylate transporter